MEFISVAGKMFELIKGLANAIQRQGGNEEHLLSLLKPGSEEVFDVLAGILVGTIRARKRPCPEIATDKHLPTWTRVMALDATKDPALAFAIYKSEMVGTRQPPNELTAAAISMIHDQNSLFEVIQICHRSHIPSRVTDVLAAMEKITDQSILRQLALTEYSAAFNIAEKLPAQVCAEIMQESDSLSVVYIAAGNLRVKDEVLLRKIATEGKTTLSREAAQRELKRD
jgi:hypothetical protein